MPGTRCWNQSRYGTDHWWTKFMSHTIRLAFSNSSLKFFESANIQIYTSQKCDSRSASKTNKFRTKCRISKHTRRGHDSDQTRTSCKTFYLTQLSEKPRVKYRFLFRKAIGRTLTQMLNCWDQEHLLQKVCTILSKTSFQLDTECRSRGWLGGIVWNRTLSA